LGRRNGANTGALAIGKNSVNAVTETFLRFGQTCWRNTVHI